MKIAVISDTHNLLRPEVEDILKTCSCILHAGDIGNRKLLDRMGQIASVWAVRGNNDKEWAEDLRLSLDFEICGLRFFMTHKKNDLPVDLHRYDIVIFGHSHKYESTWTGEKKRTLLLNPGSCGPRRFYQPVTMAVITVDEEGFVAERIEIPHSSKESTQNTEETDLHKIIETVIGETQKGRSVDAIASKHKLNRDLAETIVRLYLTHPGVTADGIMSKMGL